MSLSVLSILEVIALKVFNDTNRNIYIQMAEERTDVCYFGTKYAQAVAYRAAHIGTLTNRSANDSGPITSRGAGPLRISFGGGGNLLNTNDLSLTTYGKTLLGLIKSCRTAASVTGTSARVLNGGCG